MGQFFNTVTRRNLLAGAALAAVSKQANCWSERAPPHDLQGFTEELPPLSFVSDTGAANGPGFGAPMGFSVAVLRMMAKEAGLSIDIQVEPWVRAMKSAAQAENSILFSLVRTPKREPNFQWVGPITSRRISIYRLTKREHIKFAGLDQLKGLRIGAVRGSSAGDKMLEMGLASQGDIEWAKDDASNVRKLLASRMDLLVMLDWAVSWHLKDLNLSFSSVKEVGVFDDSQSYWFGLHKKLNPKYAIALQAALDHLKRDGRLAKMRARYFE